MTADVELLPLPRVLTHWISLHAAHAADNSDVRGFVEHYARANVALYTAAKDAVIVDLQSTIEALRTELPQVREAYQRRTRDMYAREDSIMALRAEVESERRLRIREEGLSRAWKARADFAEAGLNTCAGHAARAEARAELLAEALRNLLSRAPSGHECSDFHHSKDDRHGPFDVCPPMQRWPVALHDARAALNPTAAQDDEAASA